MQRVCRTRCEGVRAEGTDRKREHRTNPTHAVTTQPSVTSAALQQPLLPSSWAQSFSCGVSHTTHSILLNTNSPEASDRGRSPGSMGVDPSPLLPEPQQQPGAQPSAPPMAGAGSPLPAALYPPPIITAGPAAPAVMPPPQQQHAALAVPLPAGYAQSQHYPPLLQPPPPIIVHQATTYAQVEPEPLITRSSVAAPRLVTCPACFHSSATHVTRENGCCTYLACFGLCWVCCPLFWVPFVLDCDKDTVHRCSACGCEVARARPCS